MAEHFSVDKKLIPLFVPLIGVLLYLGGLHYQFKGMNTSLKRVVQNQQELLVFRQSFKYLEEEVGTLRNHVDELRFKLPTVSSVRIEERDPWMP